jgi:hypothetical protein
MSLTRLHELPVTLEALASVAPRGIALKTARECRGEGVLSGLHESLHEVLAVEGVRIAALIDIATGMIVRSAGKVSTDLSAAAACIAEEVRIARDASGARDLDEIAVVTGTRLHVSKVLHTAPGEGLVLFVDLERSKSNAALASLQVSRLAPAVLA